MNELQFIEFIRNQPFRGIDPEAMGDDCALIKLPNSDLVVTTDMLMDKVHFDTDTTSLELIARKAINVNLSDLAAAGATPHTILVSLALPNTWTTSSTLTFMKHLGSAAAVFDSKIIGGDTNVWNGPLVINIVAHGIAHWRGKMTRGGAQPGDVIFVTGSLGGSLTSGRHLNFTPRIIESKWLLNHFSVHAMMDLSDGISSDARRLATESNVDIVLNAEQIPIYSSCQGTTEDKLNQALCDGEDFELLFSMSPSAVDALVARWPWPTQLTPIGKVTSGDGKLWLQKSGIKELWTKVGYVHGSKT